MSELRASFGPHIITTVFLVIFTRIYGLLYHLLYMGGAKATPTKRSYSQPLEDNLKSENVMQKPMDSYVCIMCLKSVFLVLSSFCKCLNYISDRSAVARCMLHFISFGVHYVIYLFIMFRKKQIWQNVKYETKIGQYSWRC